MKRLKAPDGRAVGQAGGDPDSVICFRINECLCTAAGNKKKKKRKFALSGPAPLV